MTIENNFLTGTSTEKTRYSEMRIKINKICVLQRLTLLALIPTKFINEFKIHTNKITFGSSQQFLMSCAIHAVRLPWRLKFLA